MSIKCPVGCSSSSTAFLANDCALKSGDRSPPAPLLVTETGWEAYLNASVFRGDATGRTYEVCLDIDGEHVFDPGPSCI